MKMTELIKGSSLEEVLEAAPRFELGMKVLQTSALPLGYAALKNFRLYKNRVSVIKGNPKNFKRETRFELATATLARWSSTTELLSQK